MGPRTLRRTSAIAATALIAVGLRPRADRPGGARASASADLPRPDDAHTGPAAGAATGPGMDRAAISVRRLPARRGPVAGRNRLPGLGRDRRGLSGRRLLPSAARRRTLLPGRARDRPCPGRALRGAGRRRAAPHVRAERAARAEHAPRQRLRRSLLRDRDVDRLRLAVRSARRAACGRASRLRSRAGSATSAGRGSSARSRRATTSPATTRRTPTPRSRWRATRPPAQRCGTTGCTASRTDSFSPTTRPTWPAAAGPRAGTTDRSRA